MIPNVDTMVPNGGIGIGGGGTPGGPLFGIQFNDPLGIFAGDANFTWYPSGSISPGGSTYGGMIDLLHSGFGNFAEINVLTIRPGETSVNHPAQTFTSNSVMSINEHTTSSVSSTGLVIYPGFTAGGNNNVFIGLDSAASVNSDSAGTAITGYGQFYKIFSQITGPASHNFLYGQFGGADYQGGTAAIANSGGIVVQNVWESDIGATLTNGYGLFVITPTCFQIAISNMYGLYIQDHSNSATGASATTVANIWSAGRGAPNIFEGDVVQGAAVGATTDTFGFFYIDTCAGTPTGVPSGHTGTVAMRYDTTNHQLWIYDGGWKQPKTPAGAALVTWQ